MTAARPLSIRAGVEVKLTRPHENTFSRVLGFDSFGSSARGVAVGGVANAVQVGISPITFNYKALQEHGTTPFVYCDPHPSKCSPNSSWPLLGDQFAWTTFCMSNVNCNVNSAEAKDIIEGGNFQVAVTLGMYLGPHNNGQKTAVCHALLDQYPNGADVPVAINDANGNLVGFWIWHLDTANSNCEGNNGEQLAGWFVNDITSTLPLTINAGGSATTFGQIRGAAGGAAPEHSPADEGLELREPSVRGHSALDSWSGKTQAGFGRCLHRGGRDDGLRGRASPDDPERVTDEEAGRGGSDDRADDGAHAEDRGDNTPRHTNRCRTTGTRRRRAWSWGRGSRARGS